MKLIEPNIDYKKPYLAMLQEWERHENYREQSPFPLSYNTTDFQAFISRMEKSKTEVEQGFVCNTTYWLIDEKYNIYGVSNLRHHLNDNLYICGGHIGYGIRPDMRRKGYATKILELTLIEAKKKGIEKVLVTCNPENVGSVKTILNNHGQFWTTSENDGKIYNRYWINIIDNH